MIIQAFSHLPVTDTSTMLSIPFKRLNFAASSKCFQSFRNSSIKLDTQFVYNQLPKTNNMVIDNRNDRELIQEAWKPRNADFTVKIEKLDESDIELMANFVVEHFCKYSNIANHNGAKEEDIITFLGPQISEWISSNQSIIMKDGNKIIGAYFGNYHGQEEFNDLYRGEVFHDNPQFVFQPDYAEKIRNGPFKAHNINQLATLLEELFWQTGKFLPKTCEKIGLHELAAIHPNYMRFGLCTLAGDTVRQSLAKIGCTHEGGYAVATGTFKMCEKFGHQIIYSLPYDQFLDNGKPVYYNLNDGASHAHTMLMDVSESIYAHLLPKK